MTETLEGWEPTVITEPHTQVYLATHTEGGASLPRYERSFISFSYGGKKIEDFNLLSVINADRATGNVYGNFENVTSNFEVADGQMFWGSHFTNNELNLTLATDEMTDAQLNAFKQWFAPGPAKELIFAEHPNRAIMARVSAVPKYHLVPFGKYVERSIAGISYGGYITIYRGEIDLTLVADDPFWYALYHVIDPTDADQQRDLGISDIEFSTGKNEFMKLMLEDVLPLKEWEHYHQGNTSYTVLFGDQPITDDMPYKQLYVEQLPDGVNVDIGEVFHFGSVLPLPGFVPPSGTSFPYIVDAYKVFYTGTTRTPVTMCFTFDPKIDHTNKYVLAPYNDIADYEHNDEQYPTNPDNKYNYIKIGNNEFKFTTPGLLTGYNRALAIVNDKNYVKKDKSVIDLAIVMHEQIKEKYSHAWALACLKLLQERHIGIDTHSNFTDDVNLFKDSFKTQMEFFLKPTVIENGVERPTSPTVSVVFNAKFGIAYGVFKIRKIRDNASFNSISNLTEVSDSIDLRENIGDMVVGEYLYLDTPCGFTMTDGEITGIETLPIETNYPEAIVGFTLNYDYLYL